MESAVERAAQPGAGFNPIAFSDAWKRDNSAAGNGDLVGVPEEYTYRIEPEYDGAGFRGILPLHIKISITPAAAVTAELAAPTGGVVLGEAIKLKFRLLDQFANEVIDSSTPFSATAADPASFRCVLGCSTRV